ncbi:MAG: PglZ domain-containing protein [Bacteroidales bacterium]|nr:PglZ domain-containing protein [Bacteroidales bacterium]
MTINDIYQIFDTNYQLRVLFVFNNQPLLDILRKALPMPGNYVFHECKNNWFTIKYNLDHEWADKKVILYFHQDSPMQNPQLLPKFALLDVLKANMEYHPQNYTSFMQKYNLSSDMTVFVEQNINILQYPDLEKMIEPYCKDGSITTDIGKRAALSCFMNYHKVLDWDDIFLKLILMGRASEHNVETTFYTRLQQAPYIAEALVAKAEAIFGKKINLKSYPHINNIAKVLKYNAIVQKLSPCSLDYEKTLRVTNSLSIQHMNSILEKAISSPTLSADLFESFAELGEDVREELIFAEYKMEADYYIIPESISRKILAGYLDKYAESDPDKVLDKAADIYAKNIGNQTLNTIVDHATMSSNYYKTALEMGTTTLNTVSEYVQQYCSTFYLLDMYYRKSLETYYKIDTTIKEFSTIQNAKARLDRHYLKIANKMNLGWSKCIQEQGLYATDTPRQYHFYNENIKNRNNIVVIVCDAMRYEIARYMVSTHFQKSNFDIKLDHAFASLPTETIFCKMALMPYGKLSLYGDANDQRMSVDNKILGSITERTAHLQKWIPNAVCKDFKTVSGNESEIKSLLQKPLAYIFHNEIDELGHNDKVQHLEDTIQKLAQLISNLFKNNATEVLVTSDHGFLLNDIKFEDKDKLHVDDTDIVGNIKNRFYLTRNSTPQNGIIKIPLKENNAMDNIDDIYIAAPEGINRLMAPSGNYIFAHGGMSLQEMIIPVIHCTPKQSTVKIPVDFTILEKKLSLQASQLRFRLLQTEAVDHKHKERELSAALYVDGKMVTTEKILTLNKTEQMLDARKFPVELHLNCNIDNSKKLILKIYDVADKLNPLLEKEVVNNTLIENDFGF